MDNLAMAGQIPSTAFVKELLRKPGAFFKTFLRILLKGHPPCEALLNLFASLLNQNEIFSFLLSWDLAYVFRCSLLR